ncbi:MAG: response regulator [Patescibacteria group bacterium]
MGEQRKPKILVVDDAKESHQLVQEFLDFGKKKYEIVEAYDGAEGIDKVTEESPDLIIVDQRMPEMSGLKMINAIFAANPDFATPIILLTATDDYLDPGEPLEAKELATAVINKSDWRLMVQTVTQILA